MENLGKPRILYVLGLAYSGTTLFGLSIGRHSKVLNLGEIVNLENDYHPKGRCTCGETLSNCSFWKKIGKVLAEQQKDMPEELRWQMTREGKRSFLEEKSDTSRLRVLFGVSPETVYGEPKVDTYLRKNEAFFAAISAANNRVNR